MRMIDYARGLSHIGIPTQFYAETLLFYTELGFDVIYTTENPATGGPVSFLSLGGLTLEVYEDEAAMTTGAIEHIAIQVTDIEGAFSFVCSRGMNNLDNEILSLPYWENGIRYFSIEGPNKEKIEFTQKL